MENTNGLPTVGFLTIGRLLNQQGFLYFNPKNTHLVIDKAFVLSILTTPFIVVLSRKANTLVKNSLVIFSKELDKSSILESCGFRFFMNPAHLTPSAEEVELNWV
jgi:hypothetical protein